MPWVYVLLAGVVEIFWVLGLRFSETFLQWTGTTVAIIASFYFIVKACEHLPSGTVYAVFTGMGAAAIVIIDFVFLHADFSIMKVILIGLIIIGVIGLKLTTDEGKRASSVEEGEK